MINFPHSPWGTNYGELLPLLSDGRALLVYKRGNRFPNESDTFLRYLIHRSILCYHHKMIFKTINVILSFVAIFSNAISCSYLRTKSNPTMIQNRLMYLDARLTLIAVSVILVIKLSQFYIEENSRFTCFSITVCWLFLWHSYLFIIGVNAGTR